MKMKAYGITALSFLLFVSAHAAQAQIVCSGKIQYADNSHGQNTEIQPATIVIDGQRLDFMNPGGTVTYAEPFGEQMDRNGDEQRLYFTYIVDVESRSLRIAISADKSRVNFRYDGYDKGVIVHASGSLGCR